MPHCLPTTKGFEHLVINFSSLFTYLIDAVNEGGRDHNDAISVAHEDVTGVDPKVVFELDWDIDLRCPSESVWAKNRLALGKDLGEIGLVIDKLFGSQSPLTGNFISLCSLISRMRPSIMTPFAPRYWALVDMRPPQQADGRPLGCWMYMIRPSSLWSTKCFSSDGADASSDLTILTVIAGPNMRVVESAEKRRIPSRNPPFGYFNLTRASPILKMRVSDWLLHVGGEAMEGSYITAGESAKNF